MNLGILAQRAAAHFREFCGARRGNVAITFALATLPVIGITGAAVDFSHANSVKAAMQAALDSTALMLSRDAATLTNAQLQTKALSYFSALFTRPEAKNVTIAATYTASGGSQVVVNGTATVDTSLMGVVGYKQMTVNGSATSKWGSERLRVALVLDNTGSMADDGKMTALKTATKNLLTQLKSAASTNGDVYVSIIPFNKDVNLGASNYNASWIDWSDWEDDNGYDSSTTTCTTTKTGKSGKSTKKCTTSTTWVPYNHNTWNGCVTDRDQNYDQTNDAPSGSSSDSPSKLAPAEQYDSCTTVAAKALSYDWTAMNTLVDSMVPNGNTNQGIGLMWGWVSLTGGGPFSVPAMDSNYTYKKYIILLSDGLNTENRYSTSQTQIDRRMYYNGAGLCPNITASGITLYTIQVNTGGDATSTVMQNCASTSDKFYIATSASDIGTIFTSIGTNLTKLRVAK